MVDTKKPMDNLDYLMTSVKQVPTESSVLVSSSPWLNSVVLRDWISKHYLRRCGPDRLTASDTADSLIPELARIKDRARVDKLIEHEKTINSRFEAWVDEAFISKLKIEDFAQYAPGTVGGIYYKYQVEHGFPLNLARDLIEPENDYEFLRFRFGQIHDYEHILGGGGFNTLGETMPYFIRLSAIFRHLSPDLAISFSDIHVFGGFRLPVRAALNYPSTFLAVLDCMQRAIRIGMESEPVFMARFEDVLHLPPPEAREALGIRHAIDLDTTEVSRIFDDLERGGAGAA